MTDNDVYARITLTSNLGRMYAFGCPRCGAWVYDTEKHDRYHAESDKP